MSKINFCKSWKVRKLNVNEGFKIIDVPYDAMIYEERKDDVPSGKNCCWIDCHDYEFIKEFTLNEEDSKKNLVLEFEGVYHNATIFLNGEKIHFRPYGYTNFYVNITGKVKPNVKNELKVIAYNSDQPNSRWYSGSGIYRPVFLYIKDDKHIKINGVKITTLDYKAKTFKLNIKTSCSGKINIDILDNNEVLHTFDSETTGIFDQTLTLSQLKLWSEESPNLYKLRVRFFDDEETITFGLRTIEYGKDGLLINGKRVILYGACIHSDNQLLGAITNKTSELRRIRLLKEAGYNAIRSAHNPISKWLLEACDELGMYVLDEYVDCWYTHKTKYDYVLYLEKYWQEDFNDMVNKDYNHPSVIMYSTGNEVGESAHKKGIELTKTFTDYLHSLDETRPVTCGINIFYNFISSIGMGFYNDKKAAKEEISNKKKKKHKAVGSEFFNNLTNMLGAPILKLGAKLPMCDTATKGTFSNVDIAGYNYGILRYEHDLKKYPSRLILGSETFCADARLFYKLAQKHKRIIGDFVWAGMDYLGEVGVGSEVNALDCDDNMTCGAGWMSAGSGRIDLIGSELAEASYTKVAFEKETLKIGVVSPRDYKARTTKSSWKLSNALESYSFDGFENHETIAEVYTNDPIIKLFQNGKLIKAKKSNKNSLTKFKIKYVPGELKAITFNLNGKKMNEYSLKTAQKPTKITLINENQNIDLDGLVYVKIRITDNEGTLKPLENKLVNVNVSNGKLLALGTGCPYTKNGYHKSSITTYLGEALAIIKPDDKGEITVTVTSDELSSSTTSKVN